MKAKFRWHYISVWSIVTSRHDSNVGRLNQMLQTEKRTFWILGDV